MKIPFPQSDNVKCGTSLGIFVGGQGCLFQVEAWEAALQGTSEQIWAWGLRKPHPQGLWGSVLRSPFPLSPSPVRSYPFRLSFCCAMRDQRKIWVGSAKSSRQPLPEATAGVQQWAQCSVNFKNHWQHQLVRQQREIKAIHCTHTRKHLARSQKYPGVIFARVRVQYRASRVWSLIMNTCYRMWWSKVTAADWWEVYFGLMHGQHPRRCRAAGQVRSSVPSSLAFLWDASIPASCCCHPAWSPGMLLPLQHFGLSKDIKLKFLEYGAINISVLIS